MNDSTISPPTIQTVRDPWLREHGVQLSMLRLDQVHPTVAGNKWYKLKYNLLQAQEEKHDTLLTVGGAYSNHLHATAAAGRAYGFRTIGIVRGEAHQPLNSTLQFCHDQGMKLHYVSREQFRQRHESGFQQEWERLFGEHYFLPEGGTNTLAVRGCTEIVPSTPGFDHIACSVGTGGTLAGVVISTADQANVLGFPALKGGGFLKDAVDQLTQQYHGRQYDHYQLVTDYHFGGYARVNPELIDFINTFYRTTGIPLEPIYTGKLLYGLYDRVKTGYFTEGSRVLVIHSGGLQGISGFNQRYQSKKMRILVS